YYQLSIPELSGKDNSLKQVIVAGENCPSRLVDDHFCKTSLSHCDLFNEYGPTEATVWCSFHKYERTRPAPQTIGKPIPNTQIYILDRENAFVPIGVPGEICIAGPGLARGYLNNTVLTAEKFIAHPFRQGERLYKTGDLGKWHADGSITFLGRRDDQIKIRGYRVELSEIENVLLKLPEIKAAVVQAISGAVNEPELVAYVVAGSDLQITNIRSALSRHLPAYMLPHHYIELAEIPL